MTRRIARLSQSPRVESLVGAGLTPPMHGSERDHVPPTLSVVIPVRNDATLLARCLDLLAAQTLAPDEIVVVDNGSTDDSAAVARAGGARVVTCARRGIPAASSTGYDAANGDIIARLDADCTPDATWVAEIVQAFSRHPTVDVITGGARFTDGPVALRRSLAAAYLGAYYLLTLPMLGHIPVFGSNMAMRRAAWESARFTVHRHDSLVHDDLDLAFHIGEHHVIRYEPRMRMGISMRPFAAAGPLAFRFGRGLYTGLVHLPYGGPPWRLMRISHKAVVKRLRQAQPVVEAPAGETPARRQPASIFAASARLP